MMLHLPFMLYAADGIVVVPGMLVVLGIWVVFGIWVVSGNVPFVGKVLLSAPSSSSYMTSPLPRAKKNVSKLYVLEYAELYRV